jgi:hypothetical protein
MTTWEYKLVTLLLNSGDTDSPEHPENILNSLGRDG